MDTELEAKLRALVDRDEIWRVMQRYARGLDRFDVEMLRACYWDDATEDHGHYVGDPDGFIRWANGTAEQFEWTHHALSTHNCELDGDDAHCETYFTYTGVKNDPPHFLSTGRYVDHFQRRDGQWRIANRVIVVEGCYDLPDAAQNAFMPPAYAEDESFPGARNRDDASYQRPVRPRHPRR